MPFYEGAGIDSYEDFYNLLPEWPHGILKEFEPEDFNSFGPENNNRLIPMKAGKADILSFPRDIIELGKNNPGNPELEKHLNDYLNCFYRAGKKHGFKNIPKEIKSSIVDWTKVKKIIKSFP